MVLDTLADKLNVKVEKEKMQGLFGEVIINGEKVLLIKPLTYMNLSGNCVAEVLHFYKVMPEDLIVIYDDIDIDVGKLRIKPSGSPGTHNGMRDITTKIGSNQFMRVRVGSGKPKYGENLADFVLGKFYKEEIPLIEISVKNAAEAVLEILNLGIQSAMNHFN